jgi:hypothetical protein
MDYNARLAQTLGINQRPKTIRRSPPRAKPKPEKPARPVGHEETVAGWGHRVVISESTQSFWPNEFDTRQHWFQETVHHKRERRWSRRKEAIHHLAPPMPTAPAPGF